MKKKDKKSQNSKIEKLNAPKKKIKTLPDKIIPLGGGPFVGRHTTG